MWDDGYPSGGNYWGDLDGEDLYGGPSQNQLGSDGFADTPYQFASDNQDNYPLMQTYLSERKLTIQSPQGSGSTDPAIGDYTYNQVVAVTVTESPASGWSIDHWVLDGSTVDHLRQITVIMNSDHTLMAVFKRIISPPPPETFKLTIELPTGLRVD